jgi:trk system potassium uptake protein TrkA
MKQFAVVGLGNFGFYLSTRLYEKGHDVLAIDLNANRVQEIKDQVSQAVVADATNREALEPLGLGEMDGAVVCIGSDMSQSILTMLNVKDIGVKRVIVMAISEPHARIIEKLGASEVLFPEKDTALSLAERLHNPNMLEHLPFIEGYSIIELATPSEFLGSTLKDLDLINRYGVQVIALKEVLTDQIVLIPRGNYILKDSDIMIVLGPNESLDKLREKEKEES